MNIIILYTARLVLLLTYITRHGLWPKAIEWAEGVVNPPEDLPGDELYLTLDGYKDR